MRNPNFVDALHSSTRTRPTYEDHDAAADFDAWFELEEDYILGVRNDKAVREGRGLNKQIKGQQNGATRPAMPRKPSQTIANLSPPKVNAAQTNNVGPAALSSSPIKPQGESGPTDPDASATPARAQAAGSRASSVAQAAQTQCILTAQA